MRDPAPFYGRFTEGLEARGEPCAVCGVSRREHEASQASVRRIMAKVHGARGLLHGFHAGVVADDDHGLGGVGGHGADWLEESSDRMDVFAGDAGDAE